ncbi:mycothiol transferase [Actinophytocola sp.]|uniref:mycothiol transferase n=1 Tax=Actinophytocola sp. TaxID=1872138 RepID=UPI002D80DF1F|nr:DinB family protein [Actinophytocola sp.]HET9139359.1 DinB family protein [Actinophytocola sp.]
MTSAQLLIDAFGRVREEVHHAVDGLTEDQLGYRIDGQGNSIAWLVWHLTRIQDDHIAGAAGLEQVWTAEGWGARFGLPLDETDTGYGHNDHQVSRVRAKAELLTAYYDAVHQKTIDFVGALTDDDLPRIVDRSWDPPVTLAVRLISVISDDLQHAGQAAFVRGLLP